MTNPFLPLLPESSQLFSQNLQFSQNAEEEKCGLLLESSIDDGRAQQISTSIAGQTMGELLFSDSSEAGFGGAGINGTDLKNKYGDFAGQSNPFTYEDEALLESPAMNALNDSASRTDALRIVVKEINECAQLSTVKKLSNVMPPPSPGLGLFEAKHSHNSSSINTETICCGAEQIIDERRPVSPTSDLVCAGNEQSLSDEQKDLLHNKNPAISKGTIYEGIRYNHNSREFSLNGTTLDLKSRITVLDTSVASAENCRQTLKNINTYISASFSGTQQPQSNFALLRNVRSLSLRQASTDSAGSDGSDAGSPEGSSSLPSLQRAMSCDSVSSDTSVSLEQEPLPLMGHLNVSLEYDSEAADLLVTIAEAKQINGLHPDPSLPFDSYVRVYLLPDKSTNMQTRVYRKSLNPVYKEKFMFGIEPNELPIRSLVFYMYATDKYSNTLIGEAELKLRDVDKHQLPVSLWLPLTNAGQRGAEHGEIMFSLSYLPTAERLTVVVVKARNLKFPRENAVGDPFVKVYLLQRGKKVSKKKSCTKRAEKNPIFNEAMIFSVPAHALQTIQLRITVADSAELEGNRALSIGHVLVGSMSTGKPLSHWNQMLSSLRKPIAMWHLLRK